MAENLVFHGTVADLDPNLAELVRLEDKRQQHKIILIPSESIAPVAVRQLMSSNFSNIYAEGYPRPESRKLNEAEILDFEAELAYFRRYSDPRYYKGVEYADILEALTRRRAAKLFAANGISPDQLYVNVQPLSGSPANSAVYSALLEPGDTIMGLDLIHGGHLTHGSKVSRSGKLYNSVPYEVNLETDELDYESIETQALAIRPKLIIAGYTAYPLIVDWKRFREIADGCGAYLMADIAHISGLVAAGVHPSPIGIADVITTTTHKSLCGPRGAMILTHRPELARKIDRAVFPGEQGGPHLNNMAALALALKLDQSDQFKDLQRRVVHNAARLANKLQEGGIRVVTGRTENHLLLLDTKSINHNGVHLTGDMAARILDVAGFVSNSNTIPGDSSAFSATGIRLGTGWISQLGYGDDEIDFLADGIITVLKGCRPYKYLGRNGRYLIRSKVKFEALQSARAIVEQLTKTPEPIPNSATLEIRGPDASHFLDQVLSCDVESLPIANAAAGQIFGPGFEAEVVVKRLAESNYQLHIQDDKQIIALLRTWLKDLSDGYVDTSDLFAKLPGPVVVDSVPDPIDLPTPHPSQAVPINQKPYFVGMPVPGGVSDSLPKFSWNESESDSLKRTKLYEQHVSAGGRMVPFGGWDMPVWYSSVSEEHAAVRTAAGLFDVSHMGVLEASGPNAATFLNTVTTNDIFSLEIGRSHYTYLLFPNGDIVDDLLIYRRGQTKFMLVVNAANNDKDWAWLNAVNQGQVQIDLARPQARITNPAILRDLRDPQWGKECLVDLALQGPRSRDILLKLCADQDLAARVTALPWAGLTEGKLAGIDVVISRTGYTGERVAFELFVHPDQIKTLWSSIIEAGKAFGIMPCGLASRDSTRTEAGLPLYGHELDGPLNLNPAEAGFASYVKVWKPFFIGRQAYLERIAILDRSVVRFRMNDKGVRRPELGDPVLDKRGKVIGSVTSCAIDSEGYLLGQAVIPVGMANPDIQIGIYALGGGQRPIKIPQEIKLGSKLPTPDSATVLSRFP